MIIKGNPKAVSFDRPDAPPPQDDKSVTYIRERLPEQSNAQPKQRKNNNSSSSNDDEGIDYFEFKYYEEQRRNRGY